jgi:hypothetical protein
LKVSIFKAFSACKAEAKNDDIQALVKAKGRNCDKQGWEWKLHSSNEMEQHTPKTHMGLNHLSFKSKLMK